MPSRSALLAPLTALAVLLAPAVGGATTTGEPLAGRVVAGPSQRAAASTSTSTTSATRAGASRDLSRRVAAALAGSTARTLAASVQVGGLGTVLARESAHPLPPASTQKSFIAAAALLALPSDHRFVTEVAASATPTAGVLHGSLWLVAGGDPYLTSSGLRALARSVRQAGITSVDGDLRLDDSRYDQQRRPAGWKGSYVPDEAGPLSALALDGNGWRRDAAFLRDPALPGARRFRDALAAEGVTVRGTVLRSARPAGATTVATRISEPLPAVVRRLAKASDNFAAELLLKELGRVLEGDGSTASGLAAARAVLASRGVPMGRVTDGSGLSALDRQTSADQVRLLQAVATSPAAGALLAALPVACVDGTLRRRMCGTAAAANVTAKTGTLRGVVALAGYATTASGRPVSFAFQLTGVADGARARAAVDRAAAVLAASTE